MRIDSCAAVMHATPFTHVLQAMMPVRHRHGAQALRLKFQAVLDALQMPATSASLATADFSLLYRLCQDPSELALVLAFSDQGLQLSLQGQLSGLMCFSQLHSHLVYFPCPDSAAIDHGDLSIRISRSLSPLVSLDRAQIRDKLDWQSPFEAQVAAQATQLQLSSAQSKLANVESDLKIAADIQQHMLLSKAQLKSISTGLDCHACLVPSRDIGGDFYDVIPLDQDLFAVVVGDVSGKGVPASIMMATCSTLIRAYCETDRLPGLIVEKVNRRLCQGNDLDCMFTTLFIAVIDCRSNLLTYCNAGHLPGLVTREAAPIQELSTVHGPALGVFADHSFGSESVAFHAGDRLLLYTDGVTECFNPEARLYGAERLHAYCSAKPSSERSKQFLTGLLLDISLFSSHELAHDDITLLSVRRLVPTPTSNAQHHTLTVRVCAQDLDPFKHQVEEIGKSLALPQSTLAKLLLVLDELVGNLLNHAPLGDDSPMPTLALDLSSDGLYLNILLKDNAPPFDPFSAPEPILDGDLQHRTVGGLGLLLVRSLLDHFDYRYEAPWNCIEMQLRIIE